MTKIIQMLYNFKLDLFFRLRAANENTTQIGFSSRRKARCVEKRKASYCKQKTFDNWSCLLSLKNAQNWIWATFRANRRPLMGPRPILWRFSVPPDSVKVQEVWVFVKAWVSFKAKFYAKPEACSKSRTSRMTHFWPPSQSSTKFPATFWTRMESSWFLP